ncbi:Uu.00g027010.m01.CDS01 [Anthostomella pinea]|uniref:Uu.00g027010.m01.CDS01 n=1 Tax=Anthostomella pinea TaxID=933095 RepID=A0AAI8YCS7_9PEZI|nr:Uu.00g027010.m01.CDS01 [Anthostomella pinea]
MSRCRASDEAMPDQSTISQRRASDEVMPEQSTRIATTLGDIVHLQLEDMPNLQAKWKDWGFRLMDEQGSPWLQKTSCFQWAIRHIEEDDLSWAFLFDEEPKKREAKHRREVMQGLGKRLRMGCPLVIAVDDGIRGALIDWDGTRNYDYRNIKPSQFGIIRINAELLRWIDKAWDPAERQAAEDRGEKDEHMDNMEILIVALFLQVLPQVLDFAQILLSESRKPELDAGASWNRTFSKGSPWIVRRVGTDGRPRFEIFDTFKTRPVKYLQLDGCAPTRIEAVWYETIAHEIGYLSFPRASKLPGYDEKERCRTLNLYHPPLELAGDRAYRSNMRIGDGMADRVYQSNIRIDDKMVVPRSTQQMWTNAIRDIWKAHMLDRLQQLHGVSPAIPRDPEDSSTSSESSSSESSSEDEDEKVEEEGEDEEGEEGDDEEESWEECFSLSPDRY